MNGEHLRIESSNFDITVVDDPENNGFKLETPLPTGLGPEAFIGHVCVYKKIDGEPNYDGRPEYKYFYGTVTDIEVYKTNKIEDVPFYTIVITFGEIWYARREFMKITYYPYPSADGDWADKDLASNASISSRSVLNLCVVDTLQTDWTTLKATKDQATGDVTYTATGYINTSNSNGIIDLTKLAQNAIMMKYKDRVCYNFVTNAYSKTKAWRDGAVIELASYWMYPASKVVDPIVETDYSAYQRPSGTAPLGTVDVKLNISFKVLAADVINSI